MNYGLFSITLKNPETGKQKELHHFMVMSVGIK